MDKCTIGKRSDCARVHQYIPYLVLEVGYQRLQVTPSSEVPQWPTQVHPNIYGFLGNLLTGSHLLMCYQNRVEIQVE
jgi:hypothetical protein